MQVATAPAGLLASKEELQVNAVDEAVKVTKVEPITEKAIDA